MKLYTRRDMARLASIGVAGIATGGLAVEFPSSVSSRARGLLALRAQNWRASGGAPKQYDAEVEYLESFGAQWIDTGVTPNTETVLELDFVTTLLDGTYRAFCASRTTNSSQDQFSFALTSSQKYAGFGSYEMQTAFVMNVGDNLHVTMSKSGIVYDRTTPSGSTTRNSFSFQARTVTSSLNLYLFGRNTAGNPSNFAYCKMHYCKLTKDGALVRDFIPVRVGTVGYMYDRVSGALFANKGSGAFGIGPDI